MVRINHTIADFVRACERAPRFGFITLAFACLGLVSLIFYLPFWPQHTVPTGLVMALLVGLLTHPGQSSEASGQSRRHRTLHHAGQPVL